MRQRTGLDEATTEVVARMVAKTRVGHWRYLRSARQQWKAVEGRTGATDCSESGGPNALEVPVKLGEPSGIRTLDPLIKSHFRQDTMVHQRAQNAAITRLACLLPSTIVCVA